MGGPVDASSQVRSCIRPLGELLKSRVLMLPSARLPISLEPYGVAVWFRADMATAERHHGRMVSVPASLEEHGWSYWQPAPGRVGELGALSGCDVGLPPHFHDEDQVTLVLAGRRRFILDGQLVF